MAEVSAHLMDLVILCIIIGVLASPVVLMRKLDELRHFYSDQSRHITLLGGRVMQERPDEEELDQESTHIANFDRAIAASKSAEAKRIWTVKKAEFVRGLKWLNLVQGAHGSERKQQ